jgi:hypothetical protein
LHQRNREAKKRTLLLNVTSLVLLGKLLLAGSILICPLLFALLILPGPMIVLGAYR